MPSKRFDENRSVAVCQWLCEHGDDYDLECGISGVRPETGLLRPSAERAGGATAHRTGGDTKCKDFTAQDEKKQNDEISKMLKDKKRR